MPTTTITADDIVRRYAEGIGYVAEQSPATDLPTFIDQLDTAVHNFGRAHVNGHEDLETAALHLAEALRTDDATARDVFLRRAGELLTPVRDMADEYRGMVGD